MDILKPFSDDNIAGKDVAESDEYLLLEAEVEKYFNGISTEETDWDKVISISRDILANSSKDMKVLSYLILGQWKLQGIEGLKGGMEVFSKFLESFGSKVYPLRPKRRVKILLWMENVFEEPLVQGVKHLFEAELNSLEHTLETIRRCSAEIAEEEIAFMETLQKAIKARLSEIKAESERKKEEERRRKEEEELRKQEAQRKEAALKEVLERERETLERIESPERMSEEERKRFDTALSFEDTDKMISQLTKIAKERWREAPTDETAAYLLLFCAEIFYERESRGEVAIEEERLPKDNVINAIKKVLESEVAQEHIAAIESLLVEYPMWLEGYMYLADMLALLKYEETASRIETRLVNMFLGNESFSGTFFESQNRIFSQEFENRIKHKTLTAKSGDKNNSDVVFEETYQEALLIKNTEGVESAFSFLEEKIKSSRSEEERFRWRLKAVEFALEVGQKKLALSLLLGLEKETERFRIDQWNPPLAVNVYEQILKPIFSQDLSSEIKDRVYDKLCILDLNKAQSLKR